MAQQTPMMQQYDKLKRQHSDAFLFFRLGDFYELFGEDAKRAAKLLEITLTSRSANNGGKIPMCGVPFHSVQPYIHKLLSRGFKVAICEQIEDPGQAKGLVERDVVRVITPGTVTEDDLLEEKANNYLLSVFRGKEGLGIAAIDISTGEFLVREFPRGEWQELVGELSRLRPRECLLSEKEVADGGELVSLLKAENGTVITSCADWKFSFKEGERALKEHYGVNSLDAFGLAGFGAAVSSAGAILSYLEETQKRELNHLKTPRLMSSGRSLKLDSVAQRNLELVANMRDGGSGGTLLSVLDRTVTPMGGRLLRRVLLAPSLERGEIEERQGAVAELRGGARRLGELRDKLSDCYDLERLAARLGARTAGPRDLHSLRRTLKLLPELKKRCSTFKSARLKKTAKKFDVCGDVLKKIDETLSDEPPMQLKQGGVIREGVNKELDELRKLAGSNRDFLAAYQKQEVKRSGISSLKVKYNSVFGYYIEISKSNLNKTPENYVRKQTLVNAERFITPELKDYESKILGAEERIEKLEEELFSRLREELQPAIPRLQDTAALLAELDLFVCWAYVADRGDYCRPEVNEGDEIVIKAGRHPVIETLGEAEFVPNDLLVGSAERRVLMITGPNMAGKSTYLRQAALIVIMAQIGCPVPARQAKIGLVDRIFTRVGASDHLVAGQSTFMVEMNETANILHNASARSLVILDEVGRGTSTFDGVSIAWAVAEYIYKKIKAKTLFATHYFELTELALMHEGIKNLNIAVKEWEDRVVFLRRVEEGSTDRSYGIQVARLAGLPEQTLQRAREILANLEEANYTADGGTRIGKGSEEKKIDQGQLNLFIAQEAKLRGELAELDLDKMSPLEAMNWLNEKKKALNSESEEEA